MGIFNAFIVIPEIIAGAFFNRVVNFLIPRLPASIDVRLAVVMIGGGALLLAAVLMLRVEEKTQAPERRPGNIRLSPVTETLERTPKVV
jgi:hypothetical protein